MFKDIILYTFIGAALVLIVMNAGNAATVLSATGNIYTNETRILTGAGYNK